MNPVERHLIEAMSLILRGAEGRGCLTDIEAHDYRAIERAYLAVCSNREFTEIALRLLTGEQ